MDKLERLLSPLLPRLRRLARIATPDPAVADRMAAKSLTNALAVLKLNPDYDDEIDVLLFNQLYMVCCEREQTPRKRLWAPLTGQPGDLGEQVGSLPMPERFALMLVVVERLSYECVADVLDMPVEAVRAALSNARGALLRALDVPRQEIQALPKTAEEAGVFELRLTDVTP